MKLVRKRILLVAGSMAFAAFAPMAAAANDSAAAINAGTTAWVKA